MYMFLEHFVCEAKVKKLKCVTMTDREIESLSIFSFYLEIKKKFNYQQFHYKQVSVII